MDFQVRLLGGCPDRGNSLFKGILFLGVIVYKVQTWLFLKKESDSLAPALARR